MSLPTQNADVNIILNGQDNASVIVEDSVKRTNRAFVNMRNEQRAVGRQFELNNRGIVSTMRAITTLGNIAQRGLAVWQSWTLSQIRLADAQRDVRDIQKDLNEAIASGDIEAQTKHQEDLVDAMERVKQVQNDNIIGYLAMGLTIASMASNITTKALPALAKMSNVIKGATPSVVNKSPTGSINPKTPAGTRGLGKIGGLGAGVASGVASGAFYLAQLMGEQTVQAPTSENDAGRISDSGLENLKTVLSDVFNFAQQEAKKIIISVTVGRETKTQTIDLNNPYTED